MLIEENNTEGDFVTDSEAEGECDEGDESDMEDENTSKALSQIRKNSGTPTRLHSKTLMGEPKPSQFKANLNPTTGKSKVGTIEKFDKLNPIKKLEFWENEPDLLEVAILNDGASFGEVALIEDKPRGAGIKCVTDCIFATMDREDYTKTLSRIENRNINKIIDFFKDLPYFSSYGRAALDKIRFLFVRIK